LEGDIKDMGERLRREGEEREIMREEMRKNELSNQSHIRSHL